MVFITSDDDILGYVSLHPEKVLSVKEQIIYIVYCLIRSGTNI